MDNFMDKIVQKLNSQDMIRANAAAEAAELENLETQVTLFKDQLEKYDQCLQEMRKLNLKNIESAQGVQELAGKANETVGKTAREVESVSVSKIKQTSDISIAGIKQTSDISIAGINQTVEESLAKIAEIKENASNMEEITETMTGLQEKLESLFKSMEDFLHTDNVKVYRNVQASMIEELGKQTQEIKEAQEAAAKSNRALMPFVMITMIVALANIIITIARMFGLF